MVRGSKALAHFCIVVRVLQVECLEWRFKISAESERFQT